ncbi:MAG: response regulator [Natronospirillum sp.]|uniref:response regulator n=1 Tax=Natronospirillum sp. TaxID=2812955 RepID=UPI0025F20285|nr:response regulator [Natronospirillum sp.]MCH8551592.1 response regulator [Natronospirillum sp.]
MSDTLRVLVVDDASFIRDLIKRALRSQLSGIQIDEANDGRRAQSMLNRNDYDLVLCDWEMPDVSGLDVLIELRQGEKDRQAERLPFIMVTSRGDKSHVTQAVEAGVSDYIGKPFTSDQLLRKVIRQLAKNHKATLQKMMGKSERSVSDQARSAANNSAAALMGGSPQPPKAAPAQDMGGASALMGGAAPAAAPVKETKAKVGRLKREVRADLRLPDVTFSALIEDLNLTQALLRVERQKRLPQLFEQAALDIDLGGERMARLNIFVFSLQATSTDFDCDSLLVNVRWTDEDPTKYEDLSRFIARVR